MGGVLFILIFVGGVIGVALSIDRIRAVYEREGLHFWEWWEDWERLSDPDAWAARAEIFTWFLLLFLCGVVVAVGIMRQL